MRTASCVVLILLLASMIGCKHPTRSSDGLPYPLWILELEVVDAASGNPVTGCPEATFSVEPEHSESTVACRSGSNELHTYGHLSGIVTVRYVVHCTGYFDTDPVPVVFDDANLVQLPDREGPTQIILERVQMAKR
ncbi:MAG TPA: hypothetical protein VGL38_07525 [bacterium]|jgi:hypothetical protein